MQLESVPLGDLRQDPGNVRTHDDRNIDAILVSLREFGQQKPIVVDADGVVIAGNGTLRAAELLGWSHINVVRSSLADVKRTAYAIADNRTAELAAWDEAGLAAVLASLQDDPAIDEAITGFDTDAIAELVNGVDGSGEVAEDEPPQLLPEPVGKVGDLWTMGRHRVLCGDCRSDSDASAVMVGTVGHLVVTDPPYGVAYEGGQHNTSKREQLQGDSNTDLYPPACQKAFQYTDDAAPLYLWHAGVKGIAAAAADAAAAAGFEIRSELIWHKTKAHYGAFAAQYMQKHEPLYYCHKKGKTPRWFGPTNEVTVWEHDQPSRNEHHPTQKPVELFARAIRNSSENGQIVVDFFLGSGTTLIAAEQLGRTCYGIEIEPRYVDVAIRRWIALTGESPVRESDGVKWTDLADA